MRRGGFTLLEILVVLSVIGILGSALSIHLAATADRARDTAVRQELENLRLAATEFRATHGGRPPAALVELAGRTVNRVPGRWTAARATGDYVYDPATGRIALHLLAGEPADAKGRAYADY